ncbi:MAG: asparagine synthase-related protein [Anaerocolumna sp.]
MKKEEIICKRCLKSIPLNKYGEPITKGDLCPNCLREEKFKVSVDWDAKKREFEQKIESIRGKGDFDGLVMLSGGKDSIYVAYLLSKVYKLKIIALTIDNGFEYESTFQNSSDLAKRLSISHFVYRLSNDEMRDYYRFLLTENELKQKDCSQLCFFCGRLLKSISIKIAKQLNVSAVFSGHTLEQIRSLGDEEAKTSTLTIRKKILQNYTFNTYSKAITCLKASGRESLIHLFEDNIEVNKYGNSIYPLEYFDYKPLEIIGLLEKEVGWKADTNFSKKYLSSGCKLAKLLEYIAKKNGKDTYVEREFSDQIRRGSITKEEVNEIIASRVEENGEREELMKLLSIEESGLY